MYVREADGMRSGPSEQREKPGGGGMNEERGRLGGGKEEKRGSRKAEHGKNGEYTDTSRQLPSCSN